MANRYLEAIRAMEKAASEMSGGRYLESVTPTQLADTPQVPVVTKKTGLAAEIEKAASTALSRRINGSGKSPSLHAESASGDAHIPASTLNKSIGGEGFTQDGPRGKYRWTKDAPNRNKVSAADPLSVPLKDRLAQRKKDIHLDHSRGQTEGTYAEQNPFKSGGSKSDQIHNAKLIRNGGPTGINNVHPNSAGKANAANIESALRDSKAGHQTSLKFDRAGQTSFSSMAPPPKPGPQSLSGRILSKLKNGAGSAAAHLRAKAGTFLRSPLGKKVAIGAGVAGAGVLALGGRKDDEQQYYSQGYGL